MDLTFDLLLFVYLVSLVVGAAGNIVMPIVGRQMAGASPDARAALGAVAKPLGVAGRAALVLLLLSGGAMMWVRYGGVAGLNEWFWIKMALVAVLIALVGAAAILKPGTLNPRLFGIVTRLTLLGVVLAAVFAFD